MDRKRRTSNSQVGARAGDSKDLVARRKKLIESYFENGRQIAAELVQEIDAARRKMQELEDDNASLRMQLKSDHAIRDLLNKIEMLEKERQALLSRSEEVERQARSELARAAAVEQELSNLASLYVASSQLHATLDPREVLQTLGQLLLQFVGAGSYVIYSAERDVLVPVASEGLALESIGTERIGSGAVGSAFLAQDVVVTNDDEPMGPLAVVPLRVGDEPVGAVAIFALLEQKEHLEDADFELLRMVGTQGATALAGARLFAAAHGAIPGLGTIVQPLNGSRDVKEQGGTE